VEVWFTAEPAVEPVRFAVMVDAEVTERILDYLSSYEYASVRHVCFLLM